jgi:phage protein U
MFAQLGDIKFELITQFNGLTETVSYSYARHERIENKPLLQFMGKNLQEDTIKLNFHTFFCSPEEEIKKLKDAADKAAPLKFIKGNGEYVGIFVIEEIGSVIEQTSNDGFLISTQIDIRLKEYTGKIPEENEEQKGFKKR